MRGDAGREGEQIERLPGGRGQGAQGPDRNKGGGCEMRGEQTGARAGFEGDMMCFAF